MTGKYTFSKSEKLCSKKDIDRLFNEGRSFTLRPLKLIYLAPEITGFQPVRVIIAIPRKRFKRAVDRNRIRRLIREAYRLNSHKLNNLAGSIDLGFVYVGDSAAVKFSEIESRVVACLDRAINEIKYPG